MIDAYMTQAEAKAIFAALQTVQPDIIGFELTSTGGFFLLFPDGRKLEHNMTLVASSTSILMSLLKVGVLEIIGEFEDFTYNFTYIAPV